MKNIILCLIICNILQSADVLTVDPGGTVIVEGVAPTAPTGTQVRIGGGRVATGLAFDSYLGGLIQGTWASDALGPFIQWRQADKTFSVYDEAGGRQLVVTKTPPATVTAGQVVIGGGYIWAGANQLNMRPSADVPIEIVNRQTNGGIDLYPDGVVRAVRVTKASTTFATPIAVTGTVTASNVIINGNPLLDAGGKIPVDRLPAITNSPIPQAAVFNTPGTHTFTVPDGVTRISIVVIGAGGGGAGGSSGGAPHGGYGDAGGPSSVTSSFGQFIANGGGGGIPNFSQTPALGGTFSGPGLSATTRQLPALLGLSSAYSGVNSVWNQRSGGSCPDASLSLGYTGGDAGFPGQGAKGYGGGGGGGGGYYESYTDEFGNVTTTNNWINNGGCGASGAVIRTAIPVNNRESLSVVVGAGGLGGYPDRNGNNHADRAVAFGNGSTNGEHGGGGGGNGLVIISY